MQFTLPEIGFVRLRVVLMVIPVKKSCWWAGVKSGRFPKPVKLSTRCTAWRAEDIRELIDRLSEEKQNERWDKPKDPSVAVIDTIEILENKGGATGNENQH